MRRKYRWPVFLGWFVTALIFSGLTSHFLDYYGVDGLYRLLFTVFVAFAVAGIYFYLAWRLCR